MKLGHGLAVVSFGVCGFVLGLTLHLPAANALVSLRYASDVPTAQRTLIQGDLQALSKMQLSVTDPQARRVFETSAPIDITFMQNWLQARIHTIVSEQFVLSEANVQLAQAGYPFENPGIVPELPHVAPRAPSAIEMTPLQLALATATDLKVVTVMTNIGGAIYVVGKMQGNLLAVKIPGLPNLKMSTPRLGLLQVGKGLFSSPSGTKPADIRNTISRLATIFHEARHSDGNKKSTSFFHAICPDDSVYAGYAACDASVNGSYTVGALAGKMLTENCQSCSTATKESLRLEYVDSFSRVLKALPADVDPQQAELKIVSDLCEQLVKTSPQIVLPKFCADAKNQMLALGKVPQGQPRALPFLDAAPEGHVEQ